MSRCSSGSTSRPITAFARSGRSRIAAGRRQLGDRLALAGPARARRLDDQLRGEGRRRAARGAGRRPSPSGSSPRCAAAAARSCGGCRTGSKFAASSSTLVVSPVTSVSSPPMIAASAIGRSPSAISRSARSSLRATPSSVRSSSPGVRAADDDPRGGQLVGVEGVERAAEREHDVVGHVDDVRDRPLPGGREPRPQPGRRRRDRDVAEEPADVDGAALGVVDGDLDPLARRARRGSCEPGIGVSSPRVRAATSRAIP